MSDEKNPTFEEQEDQEVTQNESTQEAEETTEEVAPVVSEAEEAPALHLEEEEEEEEEEELVLDLGYDPNSAHDDFNWNITNKGGIAYSQEEVKLSSFLNL